MKAHTEPIKEHQIHSSRLEEQLREMEELRASHATEIMELGERLESNQAEMDDTEDRCRYLCTQKEYC